MSFAAARVGLRRVRRVLPRQAASDEASSSLQSFTWSTARPASASFSSRPASPETVQARRVVPRKVWGSPVHRPTAGKPLSSRALNQFFHGVTWLSLSWVKHIYLRYFPLSF